MQIIFVLSVDANLHMLEIEIWRGIEGSRLSLRFKRKPKKYRKITDGSVLHTGNLKVFIIYSTSYIPYPKN